MTTILLTVVITLSVVVIVLVGIAWWFRDDIARRQHDYEARLRAWRIQQTEFETEQRLREATRQAMNDMIAEARRHTGSGVDRLDPHARE